MTTDDDNAGSSTGNPSARSSLTSPVMLAAGATETFVASPYSLGWPHEQRRVGRVVLDREDDGLGSTHNKGR